MSNFSRDPILLTPGPLTTSLPTKMAMLRDWGSWDSPVQRDHRRSCASGCSTIVAGGAVARLRADAGQRHVLGRGAPSTRWCRATATCWCSINGAYGKRFAKLAQMMGRRVSVFETAEDVPTTAADVERLLAADASITHVGLIHCETSTGILNPLRGDRRGRRAARQEPDRRCDELVRRDCRSMRDDAVRRADRRVGQVRRRPARAWASSSRANRCSSAAPATARRCRSTCTTSGSTWRRRRNGATRRRRTSSSRSRRRSKRSSPKAGSRRGSPATRATTRRWSRGMAELGFRPFLDPRDPGADHRHVPRAGRSALQLPRVLRQRARQGLHPVSGQAHAGRDVSRRLHRRDRPRRNAARGQRGARHARRDEDRARRTAQSNKSTQSRRPSPSARRPRPQAAPGRWHR